MHLMLSLTSVVNGDRLVEPLDCLLYSTGRYVYRLLKTLLAQVVRHPLKYFHSIIVLYTYQYN